MPWIRGRGYWIAQHRNARHGGLVASCPHDMLHLARSDAIRCAREHLRELLAAETRRDEWKPGPEDEPIGAPLPLGTYVRYTGLSSRDLDNGVPVHRGELGIVVHVEPPGAPGTEDQYPEDGFCVVRFHGMDGDEDTILPRFDTEGDWRTRYQVDEL
jgi:hypothetical protein